MLPAHLMVVAAPLVLQAAALVGAVWALRQAWLSLATVRRHGVTNGRRIAARFMLLRAVTTTGLLLTLAALAIVRISTADVTREPTGVTWALHGLLAAAQLGAAHVVAADVYERWRLRRHYRTTPAAVRSRIEQEAEDDG